MNESEQNKTLKSWHNASVKEALWKIYALLLGGILPYSFFWILTSHSFAIEYLTKFTLQELFGLTGISFIVIFWAFIPRKYSPMTWSWYRYANYVSVPIGVFSLVGLIGAFFSLLLPWRSAKPEILEVLAKAGAKSE